MKPAIDSKYPSSEPAISDRPRDIAPLPQKVLDIAVKTRSNPLAWSGQFSPQLVEALLVSYAPAGGRVLDPFGGSGTVLLEAAIHNFSATVSDVNLAAVTLSKVYEICALTSNDRAIVFQEVDKRIDDCTKDRLSEEPDVQQLLATDLSLPAASLIRIAIVLASKNPADYSNLRMLKAWAQLKPVILRLPHTRLPLRAIQADARNLPFQDQSFDFILTSPPYINVFNYHQQYRRGVEALGDLPLISAKSELGSNRKHRSNRFLTVIQYALDTFHALNEFRRLLRPGAQAILVVGRESNVLGVPFLNGELVREVARRACGANVITDQARKFTNRYGQVIKEDVIHLTFSHLVNLQEEEARSVAIEMIQANIGQQHKRAVNALLEDALEKASTITPSQLFVESQGITE